MVFIFVSYDYCIAFDGLEVIHCFNCDVLVTPLGCVNCLRQGIKDDQIVDTNHAVWDHHVLFTVQPSKDLKQIFFQHSKQLQIRSEMRLKHMGLTSLHSFPLRIQILPLYLLSRIFSLYMFNNRILTVLH